MNKISIASQEYLADGHITIDPLPDTDTRTADRRVSRVKTLDGGVVITDSGFADGDRTLKISAPSSAATWARIWNIHKNAARLVIVTDDGVFTGYAGPLRDAGDRITWDILLEEKLT